MRRKHGPDVDTETALSWLGTKLHEKRIRGMVPMQTARRQSEQVLVGEVLLTITGLGSCSPGSFPDHRCLDLINLVPLVCKQLGVVVFAASLDWKPQRGV